MGIIQSNQDDSYQGIEAGPYPSRRVLARTGRTTTAPASLDVRASPNG